MKGGKTPRGYTILEVMVVLAVSGVMFLIAASFINGKQATTAFRQGANDMGSKLQDVIEQITDGQYSDIPLNCKSDGITTSFTGSLVQQGRNSQNCVFLGKLLHMRQGGVDYKYETFSIAGGRVNLTTHVPITNLSGANGADPKVIASLITQQTTPQQLGVSKITVNNSATESYGFGFFQGQGASNGASGVQTGSQNISLYYVSGLTNSMTQAQAISQINASNGGNLLPAQQVDICLTDGTRYADIILGTNNNQLSVEVKMDGNTAC